MACGGNNCLDGHINHYCNMRFMEEFQKDWLTKQKEFQLEEE